LQISEQDDAKDLIQKCQDVDLLVVDHYGIGKLWHEEVKKHLNCKLFIIDDLVREHYADVVLDQTLNRKPIQYTSLSKCLALTGTNYALLKPNFSKVREAQEQTIPTQHRLLISMGGIDEPNVSLRLLEALSQSQYRFKTTVLLSKRAPHYELVQAFASSNSDWLEHLEFIDDMASFMGLFTLAIGAPGSTSWERACLGIPSIIVPIADNQTTIALELAAANAVKVVDIDYIESRLIACLVVIINRWEAFRENNRVLCDGKGCDRVVEKIERLFSE
jgi:UDP-2,4-diacetamido-2,4,6-trideoxy-beta-L-altropyranose hydrolase